MFGLASMLLLLADVILITLFSVFLTNMIYLLLMKFTTGEKLKDIITYSQIVMTIIFMGAYQFMPRLAENQALISSFNAVKWWMFLVPPFWMSASITPIVNGGFSIQSSGFLLLSVAMPLIGLWLVSSVLARNFNQSLSTLDQGDTKSDKKKGKAETSSLVNYLSRMCSYTFEERISFVTIWRIANRDRKFKQAVYPALGYVFIMIFIVFVNFHISLSEIDKTKYFLILIYAPTFILNILIYTIRYSENYKASWIYQTIPVQHPGQIISGAFKAIFAQLFLPVFIVVNIATIYFWGLPVIIDIVYGFSSIVLMAYLMLFTQPPAFPFSEERSAEQSGRNVMKSFLMIFMLGALVGLHYLFIWLKVNLLFVLPIILLVLFWISRKYRLTPWYKMVQAT
jgi:hypothetical protein